MRFNTYREAKVGLYIFAFLLCFSLLFYFFASLFTSMGYDGLKTGINVNADIFSEITVIIDPGHGGEDPGAVANGLCEKELNLDIGLAVYEMLKSCGFNTVITRSDDHLLYNSGEENRKKYYDLRNREAFAEKYESAVFISIHMNKFPAEYCKGLQTFYSKRNSNGKKLAEYIQNNAKILQSDNERVVMDGSDNIYLLENLDMPAVLIECGFLSNGSEAALLSDERYRSALVLSIYCGISEYLENIK